MSGPRSGSDEDLTVGTAPGAPPERNGQSPRARESSLAPLTDLTATGSRRSGPDGSPPGLERARTVATLLDDAIRIPVIDYRIGLDPILGVLPVAGDTVALVASLYVVLEGIRLGVPARGVAKMVLLVLFDWVLGSIPVVGSPIDAVLKANRRNVTTIERHVAEE